MINLYSNQGLLAYIDKNLTPHLAEGSEAILA
jgi:hypothetical protein